eukprot:862034-Amphidinium_carterae.1
MSQLSKKGHAAAHIEVPAERAALCSKSLTAQCAQLRMCLSGKNIGLKLRLLCFCPIRGINVSEEWAGCKAAIVVTTTHC